MCLSGLQILADDDRRRSTLVVSEIFIRSAEAQNRQEQESSQR